MIKYTIQEIIDWAPSFSFLEIVIQKECFLCFIWVLKVSRPYEVDTDPEERFVSFKITTSNESSFCASSGYSTREQLPRGRFFEGLQNYMQNKNEGNENKIMLGDLNCTMDKIDRDGENKTQRLYRCCSNYALSKLIVDNGLEDLWRRENPDSPEFTCYDRSFTKDPG